MEFKVFRIYQDSIESMTGTTFEEEKPDKQEVTKEDVSVDDISKQIQRKPRKFIKVPS